LKAKEGIATQLKQAWQPIHFRKVNNIADLMRKVVIEGLTSERKKG
jgi:hypothetical protein